jgi:hypothetical protein
MSTTDKDTNVIVAFKPADVGEPPMTVKRADYNFCKHDRIETDDHSRTLICHGCGATLDAYDFVRKSAATIQQAWARHAHLSQLTSELVDRVDALKKEEQRLKSRIKTARDKMPFVDTRGRL